ncbi:response regulator [Kouleothrix sp.]|uniref:response regulator n=1 Tax=Kouleothrix sp. TaxID=2779161 RepID=UPI00391D87FF
MSEPISILLADDHALVREGVRAYLATQPDFLVVAEAGSGEQAVALAERHIPDVVLMDLIMPGLDGVEATRRIRQASPRTQVLVLTSYHDDEHLFPALRAGAISYLLKDIGSAELAAAIRAAARGEATLHPRVASRVLHELRGDPPNLFAELTGRELEVLRLIADGMANAQIAAALVLSEKTVKGHVGNILSKLHLADRTQAAVLAWRSGLVRRGS